MERIISLLDSDIDLDKTIQDITSDDLQEGVVEKTTPKMVGKTFKCITGKEMNYYRVDDVNSDTTYAVTHISINLHANSYYRVYGFVGGKYLLTNCTTCTKKKFERLESLILSLNEHTLEHTFEAVLYPQYHKADMNHDFNIDVLKYPSNTILRDIYNDIKTKNIQELSKLQNLVIDERKNLTGKTLCYNVGKSLYIYTISSIYMKDDMIQYDGRLIQIHHYECQNIHILQSRPIRTLTSDFLSLTPIEIDTDVFNQLFDEFQKSMKKYGKIS